MPAVFRMGEDVSCPKCSQHMKAPIETEALRCATCRTVIRPEDCPVKPAPPTGIASLPPPLMQHPPPNKRPAPASRQRATAAAGEEKKLTAYQAYFRMSFNDMREKAKAEARATGKKYTCPTNNIVKTIGENWRAMSAAQVEQFAARVGAVPPGKRKTMGGAAGPAKSKKKKRKTPTAAKPKNGRGPRRAMTAYQIFFREHEGMLSGKAPGFEKSGLTQNEIVRTIGERWRAMTPQMRTDYKTKEQQEKARFEAELRLQAPGGMMSTMGGPMGGMGGAMGMGVGMGVGMSGGMVPPPHGMMQAPAVMHHGQGRGGGPHSGSGAKRGV
jgi:hypothetical protein